MTIKVSAGDSLNPGFLQKRLLELATAANNVVVSPPAAANSPGNPGQIAYDGTYLYACIAANTWVRALFATW